MALSNASSPQPVAACIPQHVAIIMDGNGRWAKARGLPRTAGHKKGAGALQTTLKTCRDSGVKYLTIYAFSSENWRRPESEVSDLMSLLKHYLQHELDTLHESGVRMRFIGDMSKLSADVRALAEDAVEMTARNSAFNLTVALSYGGREEMVRAVQQLAHKVAKGELQPAAIDENIIADALDTAGIPEPDLLIRTGGEQRLSNFLLWQSAYTEFYFTDVLWPDFSAIHFGDALADFAGRQRRFGTTGEQDGK